MDLEIVVIIKGEIIHGENHTNEVTEISKFSGGIPPDSSVARASGSRVPPTYITVNTVK